MTIPNYFILLNPHPEFFRNMVVDFRIDTPKGELLYKFTYPNPQMIGI